MTTGATPAAAAKKPAAGGIRLVRAFPKAEPAAAPEAAMGRLSLDGGSKGGGAKPAELSAEQQWNKVLEEHGGDKEAAATAVAEQLAACDAAAPATVAGLVKATGAGALYDYALLDRITTVRRPLCRLCLLVFTVHLTAAGTHDRDLLSSKAGCNTRPKQLSSCAPPAGIVPAEPALGWRQRWPSCSLLAPMERPAAEGN